LLKEDRYTQFFEYIYDRHLIWYRKVDLSLKGPWSDDPIFQKYHFRNIHHRLDTGSLYLKEFIESNKFSKMETLINVIGYRMFNEKGLFEKLGTNGIDFEKYDIKYYDDKVSSCLGNRLQIFNPAYILQLKQDDKALHQEYKDLPIHTVLLKTLQHFSNLCKEGFIENELNRHRTINGFLEKLSYGLFLIEINPLFLLQIIQDLIELSWSKKWTKYNICIFLDGACKAIDTIENSDRKSVKYHYDELFKELYNKQSFYFSRLKGVAGKDWNKINTRKDNKLSVQELINNANEYNYYLERKGYEQFNNI